MLDNFYLELLHTTVYLYSIPIEYKKNILGHIMPVLLDSKFYTIIQSDTEISIFTDEELVKEMVELPYIKKMNDQYSILRVYQDTHKINEYGVVYKLSQIFHQREIPILYVNSFSDNFILIPSKNMVDLQDFIEY
jgi:hypothetical protein